jgi:hypothetical protein
MDFLPVKEAPIMAAIDPISSSIGDFRGRGDGVARKKL